MIALGRKDANIQAMDHDKFNPQHLFEWVVVTCICVLIGTCTYTEAAKMINKTDVKEVAK